VPRQSLPDRLPALRLTDSALGTRHHTGAIAAIKPGTAGRAGLIYCTYGGATGTYVPTSLALGADGSTYVAGYGNVGLPITTAGYAGGITDGFILVTK